MGDKHRFEIFASFVATMLPRDARIADVAGGGGDLQKALRNLGFSNVTSWDNRHIKDRVRGMIYVRKYFDYTRVSPKHYDAVIGLHPDGGTDQLVMFAVTYNKIAIICPCCVIPTATKFAGGDFNAWLAHLKRIATTRGKAVMERTLKMQGRNVVLVIKS